MKLCGFEAGLDRPLFLIAGPCVVESLQLQIDVAGHLKEITGQLGIPFIFKSSFDKANRSSGNTFRGPGIDKGLEILAKVKRELNVPVLTDIHDESQIAQVCSVVDVLQTPAFLCRQTDFIRAVAQSGKPVNIKKGQFLAPGDMKNVIDKARAAAREKGLNEDNFMACERGASFGYNNLVSDMRSLAIMRETGAPVVFDATHSVQLPGGQGTSSGGQRIGREQVLRKLVEMQYERNELEFRRGTFRVRGDIIEIYPTYEDQAYRFEMWGEQIDTILARLAARAATNDPLAVRDLAAVLEGARPLLVEQVGAVDGTRLGARCIVHSGAVIGADGFGIAKDGEAWVKIPQIGKVLIDVRN